MPALFCRGEYGLILNPLLDRLGHRFDNLGLSCGKMSVIVA